MVTNPRCTQRKRTVHGSARLFQITAFVTNDRRPANPISRDAPGGTCGGVGYGFDAYAVNIFGILGPLLAKDLDITVKTIGPVGVDYRAALWLEWTFIFAIVSALLVFGLRWIIHKSVRFQQATAEIEQRMRELGVAAWP